MKEFITQENGQLIFSDDLRTIQQEALKAVEEQFKGLGPFIFRGCEVEKVDGKYNVTAGLCFLDNKIVQFFGISNLSDIPDTIEIKKKKLGDAIRPLKQGGDSAYTYDHYLAVLKDIGGETGPYGEDTIEIGLNAPGVNYIDKIRTLLVKEDANTKGNILYINDSKIADNENFVFDKGNVGIGVTTPAAKLDVNGDLKVKGNWFWEKNKNFKMLDSGEWSFDFNKTDGTGRWHVWAPDPIGTILSVKNDGKVGIGTTDPKTKFHVVGSEASFTNGHGQDEGVFIIPQTVKSGQGGGRVFFKESISNKWGISMGYCGDHDNPILNWPGNTFCIARHNDNESGQVALAIQRSTGRVGIGTDSPEVELDIDGGIKVGNSDKSSDGVIRYNNGKKIFEGHAGGAWLAMVVPKGIIVMWSGAINAVPSGWALCDGSNGTPNLKGKFIVGYDSSDNDYKTVKKTGGKKSVSHAHKVNPPKTNTSTKSQYKGYAAVETSNNYVVGSHNHSVDIKEFNSGSTSIDNRPPYYVLAYIMKL